MTPGSLKLPFYAKIALILLSCYLLVSILVVGKEVLLPFAYAVVISIMLTPIVSFLEKRKIRRILAITIAVVIAILFTAGIIYLVASQLGMFEKSFPAMNKKFNDLVNQGGIWAAENFHVNPQTINNWIVKTRADINSNANSIIGQTLLTISGVVVVAFVIPVYIFMILYYEPLLLEFLRKLFRKTHHQKVEEVLYQTKSIIQSYLSGLLVEAVIVAALNSAALLIIGIDYAILLGIIGALLNVIPFIGGILSAALPIAIALFTKDSGSYLVLIGASYMLIQFFDNHYITPKIVASKVRINALIAIMGVMIGNAIWGIPGMFLAIQLMGILKGIFEHMTELTPWAVLLGDTLPRSSRQFFNFSGTGQKKTILSHSVNQQAEADAH